MDSNNFPIWIAEIFPFALSLSKGERKNFGPTASSRSCFDKLSTNGSPAKNNAFGKLFLTKSLVKPKIHCKKDALNDLRDH